MASENQKNVLQTLNTGSYHQFNANGGLYLVSTPIGNLGDITLRALSVLSHADVIYCEDTRITAKLLNAFNLRAPLKVYNDHSDDSVRLSIIKSIQNGHNVALVSDAGTPVVSDPGYKLIRHCIESRVYFTSVPGANAILPGLQLSGFQSDKFAFLGFIPVKAQARESFLREWLRYEMTTIYYETSKRLSKTLEAIDKIDGTRCVAVVREITKKFEEAKSGTAKELLEQYEKAGLPKGEIVLVIEPAEQKTYEPNEVRDQLSEALKTMKVKDACNAVAEKTNLSKSDLYKLALQIKDSE